MIKMTRVHKLTAEQKKILERMHNRIDYIIKAYGEYLNALSEFDRTGVLKIHGKVIYERKYNDHEN
jgi:hypothetical protein